jgi:hypothetical protein
MIVFNSSLTMIRSPGFKSSVFFFGILYSPDPPSEKNKLPLPLVANVTVAQTSRWGYEWWMGDLAPTYQPAITNIVSSTIPYLRIDHPLLTTDTTVGVPTGN